jgi:hypothetical protein
MTNEQQDLNQHLLKEIIRLKDQNEHILNALESNAHIINILFERIVQLERLK